MFVLLLIILYSYKIFLSMANNTFKQIKELTSGVINGRQVARGLKPADIKGIPGGFSQAVTVVEQAAVARKLEGLERLKDWMLGEGINKAIRMLKEMDDPGDFLKNFVNVFELVDGKKQRVQVKRTITKQMVKAPDWVDPAKDNENAYTESIEETTEN